MTVRKFRKKPVVIEAVQYDGTNSALIEKWANGPILMDSVGCLLVFTLEGTLEAIRDDWVIKGIKDEFYPCKPDIFEATYEPADDG